jgi:glutamyl-tRNA synthetase
MARSVSPYIGRLAPSPTGAQHLGNARTYITAWLIARTRSGKLLLRIEDLDTPRTKTGADEQILVDLEWLGLDWDCSENSQRFALQSQRTSRYQELLEDLKSRELVYPCTCSRTDIENASSAPHESQLDGTVYPGTCEGNGVADAKQLDNLDRRYAWRFRFSKGDSMTWEDELCGVQSCIPSQVLGDFIVARNYGPIAYQLAVVADDHDSGINHVVRGNDLIYSTYRQIAIYNAFQWKPPSWLHIPLVVGPDGKRLAKRHGDTRISTLRALGWKPETIIGMIAKSLGLSVSERPILLPELLDLAIANPDWLRKVPATNVQFTI